MRTDLLEKEQGVSELYRNTYVKAIMRGDGSFLVMWAGELAWAARSGCVASYSGVYSSRASGTYKRFHRSPCVGTDR